MDFKIRVYFLFKFEAFDTTPLAMMKILTNSPGG